jgi:hypothetical protein
MYLSTNTIADESRISCIMMFGSTLPDKRYGAGWSRSRLPSGSATGNLAQARVVTAVGWAYIKCDGGAAVTSARHSIEVLTYHRALVLLALPPVTVSSRHPTQRWILQQISLARTQCRRLTIVVSYSHSICRRPIHSQTYCVFQLQKQ